MVHTAGDGSIDIAITLSMIFIFQLGFLFATLYSTNLGFSLGLVVRAKVIDGHCKNYGIC